MKEANLISVISAHNKLPQDLFDSYLNYYSIKIKENELKDIEVFVDHLKSLSDKMDLFDGYFIGYTIPQISKEFDLLRIDDESIVDIEIKKKSTPEKIKKQLIRNKYYLSFLKKESFLFTYISDEKKLYRLGTDNNIEECNIKQLLVALVSQNVKAIKDIDNLFNPSNYLVSPFNSTLEFVKRKYFLTNQQEDIKSKVLNQLKEGGYSVISIKGKAGTGKTLLTYDIANEVSQKKEVIIIHCGYLNYGHVLLRDSYAWNIIPAKSLFHQDYSKYHLIIIDEAQRIYPDQLKYIIEEVKKHSNHCLFSYDGQQTLKKAEIYNKIEEQIESAVTLIPFELTTKIRTNKEVASFIQSLFNEARAHEKIDYTNIELNYFDNYQDAKLFLLHLKSNGWKITNYTPSTVDTLPYEQHRIEEESDNAHTVIGQEFDNVVAVIDEFFYYKNHRLSTRSYRKRPFYHPTKMLFQIVSRTRLKLCIVIINNPEILQRCLDIIKQ